MKDSDVDSSFFLFLGSPSLTVFVTLQAVGDASWSHKIHVDFKTQTGFVGLPPEWAALLQESSITAKDFGDNENEAVNEMVGLMQFFQEEVVEKHQPKEKMPIPDSDDDLRLEDLVGSLSLLRF